MMINSVIERELHEQMANLPLEKQRQVLDYARTLAGPVQGVPASSLLKFVGAISKEDLALMAAAIEEDCERIDADGW